MRRIECLFLGPVDKEPIISHPTLSQIVGPNVTEAMVREATDDELRQYVINWVFDDPERRLMGELLARMNFGEKLEPSLVLNSSKTFVRISTLAAQARQIADNESMILNAVVRPLRRGVQLAFHRFTSGRRSRPNHLDLDQFEGLSLADLVGSATALEVAVATDDQLTNMVAGHIGGTDNPLREQLMRQIDQPGISDAKAQAMVSNFTTGAAAQARHLALSEVDSLQVA